MYLMSFAMVHKNPFWFFKKKGFNMFRLHSLKLEIWMKCRSVCLLFMIPPFVFVVACGTAYWLSLVLCHFPWSGTSYDTSKFVCNQNCLWVQKRLNVLLLNPRLRTKAGGKGISGRCHNKVKVEAVSQNRLCTENLNLFWTFTIRIFRLFKR